MINNKKPIYDKHSKLTLIIDGNWLLISRLAVLRNKYPDIDSLIHNLKLLLIKSINTIIQGDCFVLLKTETINSKKKLFFFIAE